MAVGWQESDGSLLCQLEVPVLDVWTLPKLAIPSFARTDPRRLTVDLSQVEYADAIGLQWLLELIAERPESTILVGVRPGIADWLERTKLASVLRWEPFHP